MMTTILFGVWLLGLAASLGAMNRLGWKNPDTIGDCFSGDYALDLSLAVAWPIFWPCYWSYRIGATVRK